MLVCLSVCSELLTCICPSWCHCHSLSLASVKSRLVLPFWYRLTWVVLEKWPLNGGCVRMSGYSTLFTQTQIFIPPNAIPLFSLATWSISSYCHHGAIFDPVSVIFTFYKSNQRGVWPNWLVPGRLTVPTGNSWLIRTESGTVVITSCRYEWHPLLRRTFLHVPIHTVLKSHVSGEKLASFTKE